MLRKQGRHTFLLIDKITISSMWIIYYSITFPVMLCFGRGIGSVVSRYFSQVSSQSQNFGIITLV